MNLADIAHFARMGFRSALFQSDKTDSHEEQEQRDHTGIEDAIGDVLN